MRVLFIGVVTKDVMNQLQMDNLLGGLVNVEDAAIEVGHICNTYRDVDIDFTILLTHIGFEEDKRLASLLDPAWGVDVIIGGHSHTILEQPEKVNDILIVQAGVGTSQIGRFDIVVDTDLNSVHSCEWQLVPINSAHCPRDTQLEEIILRFKEQIDEKYDRALCKFPRVLTHPNRYSETELGNLMSDAMQTSLGIDLMILGSGSVRKAQAGPILTYGDLLELIPFDERIFLLKISGAHLRRMAAHALRDEILDGQHGEFYQYSSGLRLTYDRAEKRFERFEFNGKPLEDDQVLSVGLAEYHYKNFEKFFSVPPAELEDGKGAVVSTSMKDILEEVLSNTHHPDAKVEGRLVIE